jgi:hypothetical protein
VIGFDDIFGAITGQVQLKAEGIAADDFVRHLGVDPHALAKAAREAADEEFEHQHGMGPLAVARLRNLSASQRQAAHDALVDTFELAFRTGFVLAKVAEGDANG